VVVVPVQAPVQAPSLSQPHVGNCGPNCPPDNDAFKTENGDIAVSTPDDDSVETENDDFLVDDHSNGTEQPVAPPVMAPSLAQPHVGNYVPTCPLDDDAAEEVFAVDSEFCTQNGLDAAAIARVAAHRIGLRCSALV
jgi:hypothetical protein